MASPSVHSCGTAIPYAATLCPYCGLPVGIPNVRAAESGAEETALQARLERARISADATGSRAVLERFHTAANSSTAVIAMHMMPFAALIEAPGGMVGTYYGAVDAGARLPNSDHDALRGTLDSTVNPYDVHKHIRFAALSLNQLGLKWFGNVFITIAENAIANRATVFEENPFTFFDTKGLNATKPIPPGHRASWQKRADLAAVKLQPRLRQNTMEEDFPNIMMEQGAASDKADYIEVQIYGPVMPQAFARVAVRDLTVEDKAVWKRAKRKLASLSTELDESQ